MCGIAGGWWVEHDKPQSGLSSAVEAMRHRGPDDKGYALIQMGAAILGLAQTRLSIIDLSAAGHQPMFSRDGRWAIVFNGEIYNYRELRLELQNAGYAFESNSDTEVLLTAWSQWGVNSLPRLVGMFAFAVFDKHLKSLTCVRDAFGIKPFFYHSGVNSFRFASEVPALLRLLSSKPELNWQRAYDYLVHGECENGPDTFYTGIYHLPPGHWMTVDLTNGQSQEPQRWWTPKIVERSGWRFDDAVEQVRAQLLQNIQLHLRSDVPLGATLSGGIDSSVVVCAMRHVDPSTPIHTFSFIAEGSDVNEEYWVDKVNAHVGAIAHKVRVNPRELAQDLDDVIRTQGEPFGSSNIYAQYRVYKLAKEHGITVTLDGQGADEMLAGYNGYPGQRIRSLLDRGEIIEAWDFLHAWSNWPGRTKKHALKALLPHVSPGLFIPTLRTLNGDTTKPGWLRVDILRERGVEISFPIKMPKVSMKGRRLMAELASSLSTRNLSALLRVGDRNSMRFSIESRVPFLTTDLADLLLSMPEHFLISPKGETKHVLREAMRGLVPNEILFRKDKIGFTTPERDWLLGMGNSVRQFLCEPIDLPFINQVELLREFDMVVNAKKPFTGQVWRWVNFCRWSQLTS